MVTWGQIIQFEESGLSFVKLDNQSLLPFTADKIRYVHGVNNCVGRHVELEIEDRQVLWIKI